MADAEEEKKVGAMVKMKPPQGGGGFGFAGEFYVPTKKGIIEIPPEALADALTHGYEIVTE